MKCAVFRVFGPDGTGCGTIKDIPEDKAVVGNKVKFEGNEWEIMVVYDKDYPDFRPVEGIEKV